MRNGYKHEIETVLVSANGRVLDCVSFASRGQALGYKNGVRRWAAGRGVRLTVESLITRVSEWDRGSASAPFLARAV